MSFSEVLVLGASGNCIDIAEALEARGTVQVLGFLDDDPSLQGAEVAGYPVLGSIADAPRFPNAGFVCGIGSPASFRSKPAIVAAAGVPDERWITVVHPMACVSPRSTVGPGSVVLAGSIVGPRASVGRHVMVLQQSVISHDARIGDYTAVATGVCVSGKVSIGQSCYLGSHCTIRDGVTLGDRVLVGMGAAVTRDFPSESVVAGVPAEPLDRTAPGSTP